MKLTVRITLSSLLLSLGLSSNAHATLISRLSGTALYDDVLDITWLSNANLALTNQFGLSLSTSVNDDTLNTVGSTGSMTWDNANAWIGGMNSANYLNFNDWRLPTMVDTGTPGCSGYAYTGTDCGFNVQTGTAATTLYSEMASLFYDTLANLAVYDTAGNLNSGWGLQNIGPFTSLQSGTYWSGLEYAPYTSNAWLFGFNTGVQDNLGKYNNYFALAVRSGDVSAVPVPAAVWLMGSALLGLVGVSWVWQEKGHSCSSLSPRH